MRLCTQVVAASSSPAVGSSIIRICGWHAMMPAMAASRCCPPGKIEWRTIGKMFDMQQRHGLIDAFGYLRFVKMLVAWSVGDILGYGFGEKLTFGMLHDVADGGAQFLAVRTLERLHIAVGRVGVRREWC